MDPRIADDDEYFQFALDVAHKVRAVRWFINDELVATTRGATYTWKLSRGDFTTRAEVTVADQDAVLHAEAVRYHVH